MSKDLVSRGLETDFEIFSKGDADKCRDDVELALHTCTAAELFAVCAEEAKVVDVEMRLRLNTGLCTRKGIKSVFERQVWRAKRLLDPEAYMNNAFDKLQITDTTVINRAKFDALIGLLRTREPEDASAVQMTFSGVGLRTEIGIHMCIRIIPCMHTHTTMCA